MALRTLAAWTEPQATLESCHKLLGRVDVASGRHRCHKIARGPDMISALTQ